MALRCATSVRLAITGPRSVAVGAPQRISGLPRPWALGCEERTMWSEVRRVMGSPSAHPVDARCGDGCALAGGEIREQRVDVLAATLLVGAVLDRREAVAALGEE